MISVNPQPTNKMIGIFSSPNNPHLSKEVSGETGGLLMWDLWQKGTGSIHDMQVVNNNVPYCLQRYP